MTILWLFIYALSSAPQINWKAVDGWTITLIICVGLDLFKFIGGKL